MTTSSVRPVVLRNGVDIEDPLRIVLGFLKAPGRFDVTDPSQPESFGEPDLRLANRGGARISAAQGRVPLVTVNHPCCPSVLAHTWHARMDGQGDWFRCDMGPWYVVVLRGTLIP